jgi:hypothetical protein
MGETALGEQSPFGCYGEEKNLLPIPGIEPRLLLGHSARNLVTVPAELSRPSAIYGSL